MYMASVLRRIPLPPAGIKKAATGAFELFDGIWYCRMLPAIAP
jgi:hypothetical protein